MSTQRKPKLYPRILTPPDKAFRCLGLQDIQCLGELGVETRLSDDEDEPVEMWCEKSAAWVRLERGDYVVWEHDGTGVYPCSHDWFWESHERNIGDAP